MHKDPYENFYCVITGYKKFVLFPPTDGHLLETKKYKQARYCKNKENNSWEIIPQENTEEVSWIYTDPLKCSKKPFIVTVGPGETLYLPALWYHEVHQIPDKEGKTIAVNFWYDMDYGLKWVLLNFVNNCVENDR
eukprot:UN04571